MPSPFVAVLRREHRKRRIADDRLSEGRYAEWLGISPTYWSLVTSGQRPPGAKLIVCAFRAFPHNHAADELPPPAQPIPQEWIAEGIDPGCGCVACDLADAVAQGFGPPLLAVPPSGMAFRRPASSVSQRLLRLAQAQELGELGAEAAAGAH